MIKEFWHKLDAKQRKLVAGAAIFVGIALIMEIAVFPFWEAQKKLTKAINTNQKKLVEISELAAEFDSLEAKTAAIKRAALTHGGDFTLFYFLEKKATQANVRGRIKYMNSSRGMKSDSFEESLIDMKLDKITTIGAHIFYRWKGYWGQRAAFTGRYNGVEQIPVKPIASPTPGTEGAVPAPALAEDALGGVPGAGAATPKLINPVEQDRNAAKLEVQHAGSPLQADEEKGQLHIDGNSGVLEPPLPKP